MGLVATSSMIPLRRVPVGVVARFWVLSGFGVSGLGFLIRASGHESDLSLTTPARKPIGATGP